MVIAVVAGTLYFVDEIYPKLMATTLPAVDKVVVKKLERQLHLIKDDMIVKTYTISLGGEPFGHKEREGDSRTPEGDYRIDWRNPNSQFHLAMHISYPNTADKSQAERGGYSPGGAIMIHGRPNWIGWTTFFLKIKIGLTGVLPSTTLKWKKYGIRYQTVPLLPYTHDFYFLLIMSNRSKHT